MSKQEMIDELVQAANFHYGQGVTCLDVEDAIAIINKHLEGKVIVPEDPTDAMMQEARHINDCFSIAPEELNYDIYKAMLSAAKEEK